MNRFYLKIALASGFSACLIAFWYFGLGQYFTLEAIRQQQDAFRNYTAEHPFLAISAYFLVYIAMAALSLPGAAVMTLLGGAIFGFWTGLITISFASTIGATLAFLLARFMLRDAIQNRYPSQLSTLNEGFRKEGIFYLFALRLIPAFPFFLVNILTSVMPIKTRHFYGASQLGMLPGTVVYVYAGTELGKIQSVSDILSPTLIAAFVMLGTFPIVVKKIIEMIRHRRSASHGKI